MTRSDTPTWWKNPELLDDTQFKFVLEATALALANGAPDAEEAHGILELPAIVVEANLIAEIGEKGLELSPSDARNLSINAETNRRLGEHLIRTLSSLPELQVKIGEAYEARQRMMVVDPETIYSISLLALTLKLRQVTIGATGVSISLDPLKANVLRFIRTLIGQ